MPSGVIEIAPDPAHRREIELLLSGIRNGAIRAMSGAINRTLPSARTRITRALYKVLNLKMGEIRSRMTIHKANPSNLEGRIVFRRKPVKLAEYPHKQEAAGVSVKTHRDRGAQLMPGTFLSTMGSGHEGIFERRRKGEGRVPRLPIDERYGPTVLGVFEGLPGLEQQQVADVSELYEKNLDSQVDRLLQRRKPKE